MIKYLVFCLLCVMSICGKIPLYTSQLKTPKMVVFGLDNTLWPFWIDVHIQPPFYKNVSTGIIVDSRGYVIKLYPDTVKVLDYLSENKIRMAVASSTPDIDGAKQLITILGWNKYFATKQIYPISRKSIQLIRISRRLKVRVCDMIYFDAKHGNIIEAEKHGIMSYLLPEGITVKDLMHGFFKYSDSHSGLLDPKVYREP